MLGFIFFLSTGYLSAQNTLSSQGRSEVGFVTHLINTSQYEDAIFHLSQLPVNIYSSQDIRDSMQYLEAWAYYSLKQLDSSAFYFLKVTGKSALYKNALFFAASDYIFLNNADKAKEILAKVPVTDSVAFQLRNLQYAGLSLLKHDYDAYGNYSLYYGHSHYALTNEEIVLDDCYKNMKSHNNKSLFVAGALSAIVPGSGKFYAGKKGEGVSSFLLIGFLGAVTAENYIKAGATNYKTIIFGSLFTVFYIGNIYGSIASLKLAREEFYRKYENTVQLHIHIPVRTIYGR
jgi:tetratricopeptide (TPR) repeat protein